MASLFNRKAKLWLAGRRNLFETIADCLPTVIGRSAANVQPIWFHCSSLGEFEQVRPLVEKFKTQNAKIIITFFSPSGYEIRKNYEGADLVCYLPLDTKTNAKRFLDLINPSQVFFVKYDFWYNYLCELSKRNIPAYLVSANFRDEQFKGFYGSYLTKVLKFFTKIFVQNPASQQILSANNIAEVIVSGDLRFDRVSQIASSAKKIQIAEMFKGESKVLVCGSTWPADEVILSNLQSQLSNLKWIIAPHEINESHIHSILSLFQSSIVLRYSEVSKEPVSSALPKLNEANILILDNIGMLSSLYQYADIAYIGGGFGAGIHNILEAAAFGVPVLFGPHHHKFPEANELAEQGGGFSISNQDDFKKAMNLLLSDEKILKMASMVSKNFVQQRKGAVEKIICNLPVGSVV